MRILEPVTPEELLKAEFALNSAESILDLGRFRAHTRTNHDTEPKNKGAAAPGGSARSGCHE
jgi:hypothetical protein